MSFDQNDVRNIGRPIYFSMENFIETIIGLIRSDEIQSALWLLDNPPGYYRDNPDPRLIEIKNKIYQNTYDQIEYATDDEEADCTREFGEAQWDNGYMFPRAQIISEILGEYNSKGQCPWIFDLGCSHGNLVLGLMKHTARSFKYRGAGMNHRIIQKVKAWAGNYWRDEPEDRPTILYCSEVLEHMMNPHDLIQSAHKVGVNFDQILLSTPKYTLGGGLENWNRRLGHVRTWTPKEFLAFADKGFPGYQWTYYDAHSMVIVGTRGTR